jgi:hypothetical protein
VELLPLLLIPFVLLGLLIQGVVALTGWIVDLVRSRQGLKRQQAERELDRTQAELRATILTLASELGADALEARKALIRESYLATGRTPDQP